MQRNQQAGRRYHAVETDRVCPSTRAGGEVAATGIPLNVGDTVVVCGTKQLHPSAPVLTLAALFGQEIQVPEIELGLAG